MDRTEMEAVVGALKRINRCLDERFEKDADLYLSPEQVEEIKKLIYGGKYDRLVKECSPVLKKFSPRVMVNVLVKNAWLMRNGKYEILRPIFDSCEYDYFRSVMTDVFENRIDMPTRFRFWLIATCLEKNSAADCRQMLAKKLIFLNHPTLKAICIRQILKDEPINKRYRQFNDYVADSKSLLTQKDIVNSLFPSSDLTDAIRNLIFNEHIKQASDMNHFWVERLEAKDIPFVMDKFKEFCRQNSSHFKECADVLSRLYPISKKNFSDFAERFAVACACMDGYQKANLAKSCLRRTNSEETKILQAALSKHGIVNVEKGELADADKIIEILSENFVSERALRYLVASFDEKYRDDYENTLEKIRQKTSGERFGKFCCTLFKIKYWRLKYLVYVINKLVPAGANKNNSLVKEILEHVHDKDILREFKFDKDIERVIAFVKEKDFSLFEQLTRY